MNRSEDGGARNQPGKWRPIQVNPSITGQLLRQRTAPRQRSEWFGIEMEEWKSSSSKLPLPPSTPSLLCTRDELCQGGTVLVCFSEATSLEKIRASQKQAGWLDAMLGWTPGLDLPELTPETPQKEEVAP